MSLDWFRDLVICVLGLVTAGVLIFIAVLLYSLYHRARFILDSVKTTVRTIQVIFSYVEEVAKPVIQVVAFIRGIRQGVSTVRKFFEEKEGGKNG